MTRGKVNSGYLCLKGESLDSDPDVVAEEHRLSCSKLIGMSDEMRYSTFLFSCAPLRHALSARSAPTSTSRRYRAAKLHGERDAAQSMSRALPAVWDRGNAATFGPPAISGGAATRAQTATELEVHERTLQQPLVQLWILCGGRMCIYTDIRQVYTHLYFLRFKGFTLPSSVLSPFSLRNENEFRGMFSDI